ncbi:hypothetical protein AN1V17_34580 [Vallitalea sediminicola]
MNLKVALLQLEPNKNDQLANHIKADAYCRKAAKLDINMTFLEGETLGGKAKKFKWKYCEDEGLTIYRVFSKGSKHTSIFSDNDLDNILDFLKNKQELPLANSVDKMKNGTEKEGFGSFIYNKINADTKFAQSASQLVAILTVADIIGYNEAKRNMKFYYKDSNWKTKLIEYIKTKPHHS